MIEHIFSPKLVSALGWTLVHTLWQAALFALLLGAALLLLRKYSARTRYVTAIGVLAAFFLTALLTFGQLYTNNSAVAEASSSLVTSRADDDISKPTAGNEAFSPVENPTTNADIPVVANARPGFRERMMAYYDEHLPLIVTLWLMGVLILQLRFLGQLAFLQRLKNYGTERFPVHFAPMLQELETKLGIEKPVRYLTSFRVGSPFTAGWLRPAVLFPRGLLGELNEAQLRTIIAHELAHIKRHDFVVNLIQTLLCTLFFYHPAAWWISARIDEEREHCCDDLAIEVTGEAVGYAKTLLQLKENELSGAKLGMAYLGKGDGFKDRITRLLTGYLGTGTYGEGFTTAVILFCFMGLAVTLSAQDRREEGAATLLPSTATETYSAPASAPDDFSAADPGQFEPFGEADVTSGDETQGARSYQQWKRQALTRTVSDSLLFPYLMEAIREGSVDMIAFFLEKDVDLTQTDARGLTPLALAAGENRPDIIRLILRKGADVNYVTPNGWTALIEAADEGAYEAAQALLEAGAKVDVAGTGRSAADMAASEGHPEILRLLTKNGADLSGVGRKTSPLHQAAEEGQFFVVQSLLQAGADAGAKDGYGRTALSYAAEEGHGAVVTLLAAFGHVNDTDNDGRTAISYAAEEGHEPLVSIMQSMGGIDTGADHDGRTPLHYAAHEGMPGIVRNLIADGAKVNARDDRGMTPLHYAVMEGHPEIVQLLLNAGADAQAVDERKYSVLDYALNEMLDWLDEELAELGPGKTFNDQTGYPRNATVDVVWKLLEKGAVSDRIQPKKNWILSADGRTAFPYILDKNAKLYKGPE